MKMKKILLLVCIALFSSYICAQEDGQIDIGYSDGEVAKYSELGRDSEGTISAAICVDPSSLGELANLKIVSVSIGLASRLNVAQAHVWVREELDGADLVTGNIETVSKGWNEVYFESADIPNRPLYVGYTLTVEGGSYPVSVVGESCPGGLFVNLDGEWKDMSSDSIGVLSLSVIVEADNLPEYDLALLNVCLPEQMKIGGSSEIRFTVKNMACRTITSFDIITKEGDDPEVTYPIECTLKPSDKTTVSIDYSPTGAERERVRSLTLAIDNLKEGQDMDPSDNSLSGTFNLCKYSFVKRVLLEEFTTSLCGNCPAAAEVIHSAVNSELYSDRVVVVAHHAGFGTDAFTLPCDVEMLDMYGSSGGTYCPALMFDRTPLYSDNIPVVSAPQDVSDYHDIFDKFMEEGTNVSIDMSAAYNDVTGKLDVKVVGGRDDSSRNEDSRITVYLLENDVLDVDQTGGNGVYMQQHVVRAYSSTWGESVDWSSDDDFMYTVSLSVPYGINTANTQLVVVVNDYDAADIGKRTVENVASAYDIDWGNFSGIPSVDSEKTVVRTVYHDLTGRQVESSACGVLIKTDINSDGTVSSEKVINY